MLPMKFNVRVFVDGKQVASSELPNITIKNTSIDKIVNNVVDRNSKAIAKAKKIAS